MRVKLWLWPLGASLCLTVIFGIIKVHKHFSRQDGVPTASRVCRYNDLSRREKGQPITQESILPLANQPLFFLGKAQQSVVYETADGQYVLKMFKKALRNSHKKPLEDAIFGAIIAKKLFQSKRVSSRVH